MFVFATSLIQMHLGLVAEVALEVGGFCGRGVQECHFSSSALHLKMKTCAKLPTASVSRTYLRDSRGPSSVYT